MAKRRVRADLSLPLTHISAGLGVLLIASLTTLALAVDGKDALATTALGLAIVAFVVQLLVFIVQGVAANDQMVQSQELYGKMLEALAQIGERTAHTERVVERLDERVVGSALGKGYAQTSQDLDPNDPEFVGALARNVLPYLREAESPVARPRSTGSGYPLRSGREDQEIRRVLLSWPPADEAESALETLEGLSEDSRNVLLDYAADEYVYRGPDTAVAPGYFGGLSNSDELLDKGLVAATWGIVDEAGEPLIAMTDAGRAAVRLLTAEGDPPAYIDRDRLAAVTPPGERWQRERASLEEMRRAARQPRTSERED
ncbi:MAG: hypothetical protein ACJ752_00765 [Gaiellaceae bacterium]